MKMVSGRIAVTLNHLKGTTLGLKESTTKMQNMTQRLFNAFVSKYGLVNQDMSLRTLNESLFDGNKVILSDYSKDEYVQHGKLSDWIGALGLSSFILNYDLLPESSSLSKLIAKDEKQGMLIREIFSYAGIINALYSANKEQGEEAYFSAKLDENTLENVLGASGDYQTYMNRLLSQYIIEFSKNEILTGQRPRYLEVLKKACANVLVLDSPETILLQETREKKGNLPYVAILDGDMNKLKSYFMESEENVKDFMAMMHIQLPFVVPLYTQGISTDNPLVENRRQARSDFYAYIAFLGVKAMANMNHIKTQTINRPNFYTQAVDSLLGLYTSMIPEQFQKKVEKK